ncbi:hypothetical protein Agub_g948 [Astrephomene gubernaculifera]|uniref:CTLH domain-containing protein n=1 Tax=Astrephomene gubernaculifera TaxID=47775 RepID=A0AAD3DI43_9CHLO|nr:hypothetical protein Agub_g942 [Astrephomene gubernaculifera]GFR40396.1 hypothetical protein Agub_g948 [Astrephomene gubernaculifera]
MAKEQELSLPVLDELVKDYAEGILGQTTGAWERCNAMRQLFLDGDVDAGLAVMREICPTALEDVRLMFRAKKQKFIELLRSGGGPEAALACARSELAPLALDAYPEAYGEFKRLLLMLLQPPGDAGRQSGAASHSAAAAPAADGDIGSGVEAPPMSPAQHGEQMQQSSGDFVDLAYFTVRHMLGLQHPQLGLLLRYLLRLHLAAPPPPPNTTTAASSSGSGTASSAAAVAGELVPRLLCLQPPEQSLGFAGCGVRVPLSTSALLRDPPPLPPAASSATAAAGGSGGVVPQPASFPEAAVQAVIQGAATTRAAALEALRHAGGNPLSAFRLEVGRLVLHEPLLAELVLEYGGVRGLLGGRQEGALQVKAAEGGGAAAAGGAAAGGGREVRQAWAGRPGRAEAGSSPPAKIPRWSPPADEEGAGAGTAAAAAEGREAAVHPPPQQQGPSTSTSAPDDQQQLLLQQQQRRLHHIHLRPQEGKQHPGGGAGSSGELSGGGVAMDAGRGAAGNGFGVDGNGSGGGDGSSQPPLQGRELLSRLVQLAQAGDAEAVCSLVSAADPGFWSDHPALLFGVRRWQYGRLLAGGRLGEALGLARSELAPLASAHPTLLPRLKDAMAALLPGAEGAEEGAATGAVVGSGVAAAAVAGDGGGAACSLVAVAGQVVAALQPRLGLRGPRLVALMEVLLASHRTWMRSERLSEDPFAAGMRIGALHGTAAAAGTAEVGCVAAPGSASGASGAELGAAAGGAPIMSSMQRQRQHLRMMGARVPPWPMEGREGEDIYRRDTLGALLIGMGPPGGAGSGGMGPVAGGGGATAIGYAGGGEVEYRGGFGYEEVMHHADDDDEEDVSEGDGGGGSADMYDEAAVLQVMEVLELPRGAAIELLVRHHGDVQAAVLSMMQ